MGTLGCGVRLYFDFLCFIVCMAVVGLVTTLPSFIASLSYLLGDEYDQQQVRYDPGALDFPNVLAIFTLGSRVSFINPTTNVMIFGCESGFCKGLNLMQALLDSAFCLLFFFAARTFIAYTHSMAEVDDALNLRVNDYSIHLHGLDGIMAAKPKKQEYDPKALKAFVETALQQYATEMSKHENERLASKWQAFLDGKSHRVWDVTIIANDCGLLRSLVRNVPYEEKAYTLREKARRLKARGQTPGCLAKYALEEAERKRTREREKADEKAKKCQPLKPVGAFITFEDERAKHAALAIWGWGGLSAHLCTPPPDYAVAKVEDANGQVVGRKKLYAYQAPAPGDVMYENMATHFDFSTKCRRCVSFSVLMCVILVSLALSIIVFTITNLGSYITVMIETYLQEGEAAASDWSAAEAANATAAIALTCTADEQALISNITDYFGLVSNVYGEVRDAFGRNDTDAALRDLSQSPTMEVGLAVLNCWLNTFLTVFTSAVTITLNLVITSTIETLARWSRFSTYTEQNMAVVLAIAIAQFINTALVIFIVNHATGIAGVPHSMENPFPQANYLCIFGSDPLAVNTTTEIASPVPQFDCLFGPHGIFLRGGFFTFDPRWYSSVGASICFTMLLMPFTSQATPFALGTITYLKRVLLTNSQVTLESMRALYTGPTCNLHKQVGKLYAYVAIVLIFSSLMPILFLFLLLYGVLAYVVDKFAFLRIYRKPPPFSHTYISDTLWWVQFALVLKLFMGWWAFWQMPGASISEAAGVVRDLASQAAIGVGAGDLASSLSIDGNSTGGLPEDSIVDVLTGGWLSTAPQALFLVGMVLLLVLVVLCCVLRIVPRHLLRCEDETHHWHPAFPLLKDVLEGSAVYSEVRSQGKEGEEEILYIRSDVLDVRDNCCFKLLEHDSFCYAMMTPARFVRCAARAPVRMLLYCFGIRTWRERLTPAEFESLKQREVGIVGKTNMSFGPAFNPNYERAFRYAELDDKSEASFLEASKKLASDKSGIIASTGAADELAVAATSCAAASSSLSLGGDSVDNV